MATNDFEEEPRPSTTELAQRFFGTTVAKVTDTDPVALPLRTWLLLVVVGLCCVTAPAPANYVGVIAVVALALSAVPRRRSA